MTTATSLAAELRRRITAGDYAYGARMPSVRELAERYETSQQTAAAAYAALEGSGMVRVGRGREGTTVTAGPPADAHLGTFTPPDLTAAKAWRSANDQGATEATIEVVQTAATPEMVAWGIPEGSDVVIRTRLRTIDGVPVQHKITVMPLAIAERQPEGYTGVPPMLAPVGAPAVSPPEGVRIADWLGWDVAGTECAITAEPMSHAASAALGLPQDVPGFAVVGIARNSADDIVYVTVTTAPLHHRITLNITE
ncbi:GntR family transcriptional regulator [Streptomyces diastaticus]|uniref:Kor n=3 Tax=unclassified Streptomyces TaxID=2593676 RepID=D2KKV9_9ACTN|nr:GntR family transcriptional regulator [Streptomyces sp. Y27]ADA71991.1 Kor [Streptomyces sp. Y27]